MAQTNPGQPPASAGRSQSAPVGPPRQVALAPPFAQSRSCGDRQFGRRQNRDSPPLGGARPNRAEWTASHRPSPWSSASRRRTPDRRRVTLASERWIGPARTPAPPKEGPASASCVTAWIGGRDSRWRQQGRDASRASLRSRPSIERRESDDRLRARHRRSAAALAEAERCRGFPGEARAVDRARIAPSRPQRSGNRGAARMLSRPAERLASEASGPVGDSQSRPRGQEPVRRIGRLNRESRPAISLGNIGKQRAVGRPTSGITGAGRQTCSAEA